MDIYTTSVYSMNHLLAKFRLILPVFCPVSTPRIVPRRFSTISDLCEEAKKIALDPNAGGNSIYSEVLSMEILNRHYNAKEVYSEMEVEYVCENWKKVDYVTKIGGTNVGVSVTRAIPNACRLVKRESSVTDEEYVDRLLKKKLDGLVIARSGTIERYDFYSSILFVWSPNSLVSRLLFDRFDSLSEDLSDDIHLVVVECDELLMMNDFCENRVLVNEINYRVIDPSYCK